MKFAKEFKKSFIILIVCCFALGVVLLVYPQLSEAMLCYVLGALTIVYGLTFIVSYFMRKTPAEFYRFDFVAGVVLAVCGVYIIANVSGVVAILNTLLGLVLLLDGLMKLQNSMDLHRMDNSIWWSVLLCAAITVLLGVMLLWYKDWRIFTRMQFIGLCLVIAGVVNAWSFSVLSVSLSKLRKRTEEQSALASAPAPVEAADVQSAPPCPAQDVAPAPAPEQEPATV